MCLAVLSRFGKNYLHANLFPLYDKAPNRYHFRMYLVSTDLRKQKKLAKCLANALLRVVQH